MARRTILIVSLYYAPEALGNAPYVTGLADHLGRSGDNVVIVAGYPHYPGWKPLARRFPATAETIKGVRVRRRPHTVPRQQSALRRLVYEASFVLSGATALGLRHRPDVILGITPSLSGAVLAATAARGYGRPYGLVFQDVMGRAAEQSNVPGAARIAWPLSRAELTLARRASGIVVVSEGFRRYFEDGGVGADRIFEIPNWARFGSEELAPRAVVRSLFGWSEDEFVCLHAGNMGQKQGLSNLLDTAAILDGSGVHIVLAGDGNDRDRLVHDARERMLKNLSFLPVQPTDMYASMLRAADVLLVNQRSSVVDMSLPSRLTSYFASGKPVVAAVAPESATRREVERSGGGLAVVPDNPSKLAETLLALRRDPSLREALAGQGRRYAEASLSPSRAMARYDRFIASLVAA